MDTTVITDSTATSVTNRRYRRSEKVSDALAFQCAHVQEGLALEAVVVTDDTGDRWVGSGDKRLCRLLSRSANQLVHPTVDAELRIKALRSLRSDLGPADITTYAIRVPERERFVFVTGVGKSVMRDNGVVGAAGGVKRILGFNPAAPAAEDPQRVLQRLVTDRYHAMLRDDELTGPMPSGLFGMVDDRIYSDVLDRILEPALDTIVRSGLVSDALWKRYRWSTREVAQPDGSWVRLFAPSLREPRTGARVGVLEIEFHHRHDRFDVPFPPALRLRWT